MGQEASAVLGTRGGRVPGRSLQRVRLALRARRGGHGDRRALARGPVVSLAGVRADAPGIETLAQEGSDIPALIELENRSRLPRYVLECSLRLAGGSGGGVMGRLGGLGSASLSRPRTHSLEVSVRRVRRGVYERGSVEVGSGIPFGLFHVIRRFPVAANA